MRINLDTGEGVALCVLDTALASYNTLTFSRENLLFAAEPFADRLDLIDPCTCEVSQVGLFNVAMGPFNQTGDVNFVGITSTSGAGLFGIEPLNDNLHSIALETGQATGVGPFGVDFSASGATWSEAEQVLYAINASDDALYSINPFTGAATHVSDLDHDFGGVGIEQHPGTGVLYACDTDGMLYSVDIVSGVTTQIGEITGDSCNNLAAPWEPVDCISNP